MLDADKRRNLHGSGATITSAYTEQEIQAARAQRRAGNAMMTPLLPAP